MFSADKYQKLSTPMIQFNGYITISKYTRLKVQTAP